MATAAAATCQPRATVAEIALLCRVSILGKPAAFLSASLLHARKYASIFDCLPFEVQMRSGNRRNDSVAGTASEMVMHAEMTGDNKHGKMCENKYNKL